MAEAVTPPNPADPSKGSHHKGPQGGEDSRSSPDPTLMTIDALRREIAMLENLINTRLEGERHLLDEKIYRIDQDLEHFEEQRLEQKKDTRSAVEAALESQKEATQKMEKSMASQIESLKSNFDTSIRSVHTSVADLKERMTILESVKQGATDQRVERRQITSGQLAALGVAIAVFMLMLSVVSFFAGSGV